MYSRIFVRQMVMGFKLYLRNPSALFWLVAFPVFNLLILGAVFSGHQGGATTLVWSRSADPAPIDRQLEKALADRGLTAEILSPGDAETRWALGKTPALLDGRDGRYTLQVNSEQAAQGMAIEAQLQQAFMLAQGRLQGAPEPERIPLVMVTPGGHRDVPYAAFLLPGLMGLNLLMIGLFSVGMVDVMMREKGGYKRLATTPLPRGIYLGAQLCVRLSVVFVAATALVTAGALVFGVVNQGSYVTLFALVMAGAACFISMGYLLSSMARTIEGYSGIANMVYLPLMFLSGVYFSLDSAPGWLRQAAGLLPLAALLKALRAVFNDGASLVSQGPALALIGAWTLLLFALATKRFRWV